jgi:SpoVK/Ycf46/Vps4 family AAA+-type ATPase
MRGVTTSKGKPFHYLSLSGTDLINPSSDVDPKVLARGTPGFSGADLQNMVKYVILQSIVA